MDMNTAFDLEVQRHCLRAEVVYDLFHVVSIQRCLSTSPTGKFSRIIHGKSYLNHMILFKR